MHMVSGQDAAKSVLHTEVVDSQQGGSGCKDSCVFLHLLNKAGVSAWLLQLATLGLGVSDSASVLSRYSVFQVFHEAVTQNLQGVSPLLMTLRGSQESGPVQSPRVGENSRRTSSR